MSTFDQREKDFERKFQHDEELKFRVTNRRNKLLGLWASEHLGKSGDEASAYALEVVESDFTKPGEDDVVEKVQADFDAAGVKIDSAAIKAKMAELLDVAREQVMTET